MATVDRVLPWRRSAPPPTEEVAPLLTAFRGRNSKASAATIVRAYELASQAHQNQYRNSGEKYINHPLSVARIVADLGLDETSIASALLHDVVEDCDVTLADIEREFGSDIAAIVDGCTKIKRLHFDSREEQQAATMRKMLVAIAKDVRVLIIKLSDRLHNMRTIAALPPDRQARTAQETLDIYAPLAHRLGMQELKQQLEDLSFAALHPKRYAEIEQMVFNRTPQREVYLARMVADVRARLSDASVQAEVTGRGKHLWSIYEKMVLKGKEFDDIFDLVALRVVVDTIKDCYAALGTMHNNYTPVVGRFKDYIAMPKFNAYQSLHTTVMGPDGKFLEVQIRTKAMHIQAEMGVAAHWAYKEGTSPTDLAWLNRIVEWQKDSDDPAQFLENLKIDLDQDEVFVFTPKGKVIVLPAGSTPVDFAYSVHTEVGHACIGARANGRLVPLDKPLRSGDTVEVFTAKVDRYAPSRDWLSFVESPRARNKIRQWFSRERRGDAIESGREEMVRELRRAGLPVQKLMGSPAMLAEAVSAGFVDIEALYVGIGEHHISGQVVAQRLFRSLQTPVEDSEFLPATTRQPRRPRRGRNEVGVHVEGLDDVMVRLSRCCTPVPGDDIIGFITRGRGVSVHRADCANAVSLSGTQTVRMVDVEWSEDSATSMFVASIEVRAFDRSRLLRDVSNAMSDQHVNIVACSTHTGSDRESKMRFDFELADPGHLDSVLGAIKNIEGVYDAYRLVPGKGTRS